MKIGELEISDEALGAICRRWKISRLELFGSARTARLQPESDIDLLAVFESDERWSLMDLARLQEEFSVLFGRTVDLIDRKSLERSKNWLRRKAILHSTEVVYGS